MSRMAEAQDRTDPVIAALAKAGEAASAIEAEYPDVTVLLAVTAEGLSARASCPYAADARGRQLHVASFAPLATWDALRDGGADLAGDIRAVAKNAYDGAQRAWRDQQQRLRGAA